MLSAFNVTVCKPPTPPLPPIISLLLSSRWEETTSPMVKAELHASSEWETVLVGFPGLSWEEPEGIQLHSPAEKTTVCVASFSRSRKKEREEENTALFHSYRTEADTPSGSHHWSNVFSQGVARTWTVCLSSCCLAAKMCLGIKIGFYLSCSDISLLL